MIAVAPRDAQQPLVLALDVGTSSLRGVVFDRLGRAVDGLHGRSAYEARSGDDGTVVLDPPVLLAALFQVLDGLHRDLTIAGVRLAAVAVDTFASSTIALDEAWTPLTPVFLWADTRPSPDAEALRREVDERAAFARSGCPIHSSYLSARVRWLRRTEPDLARRVARWASLGDLIEHELFGEARSSISVASWTGLLDRHSLSWDAEWLRLLELDERQLSPLVDRDEPLSGMRSEHAARWPLLTRIPWFPAIGDGAAANVGSGCIGSGRAALTIGTSSAMRLALQDPVPEIPWGLWCYRVDRGTALLGGALSEGGNVYAWLAANLALGSAEQVEEAIAAMEPDGHGLTVLPFLAGERSPGWAGNARGAFVGLSLHTSSLDLLRASLEAVAYRLALVDRLLAQVVPGGRQAFASGGALLHSPAWLQIMADVLGKRLIEAEDEATAKGTALLALQSLGAIRSPLDAPRATGRVFEPDPSRHQRYQEAIARQERLYQMLVRRDGPSPLG